MKKNFLVKLPGSLLLSIYNKDKKEAIKQND
jgi:hypothetical protein